MPNPKVSFVAVVHYSHSLGIGLNEGTITGRQRDTYQEAENDLPSVFQQALKNAFVGAGGLPYIHYGEVQKRFIFEMTTGDY